MLEEVSQEQFFKKSGEKKLAFLYQDRTADGQEGRLCKLVKRQAIGKGGGGAG